MGRSIYLHNYTAEQIREAFRPKKEARLEAYVRAHRELEELRAACTRIGVTDEEIAAAVAPRRTT